MAGLKGVYVPPDWWWKESNPIYNIKGPSLPENPPKEPDYRLSAKYWLKHSPNSSRIKFVVEQGALTEELDFTQAGLELLKSLFYDNEVVQEIFIDTLEKIATEDECQ